MRPLYARVSSKLTAQLIATTVFLMSWSWGHVLGYAQLASGPTGSQSNGYYTNDATFSFRIYTGDTPDPNASPNFTFSVRQYVGFPAAEGTHTFSFYNQDSANPNASGLCIYIDGKQLDCPVGAGVDNSPKGLFYTKTLSFDTVAPTVSLSYPSNNTNIDADKITVSGLASDTGSGIDRVVLNGGVNAAINGSHWTASIPLANGLNTIQAFAYDKSGRVSESNSATVFAQYSSAKQSNSNTPSATTSSGNSNGVVGNNERTDSNQTSAPQPTHSVRASNVSVSAKPKPISWPAVLAATGALGLCVAGLIKLNIIQVNKSALGRYIGRLRRS